MTAKLESVNDEVSSEVEIARDGNDKGNSDGSYVFVSENEAVCVDSVDRDQNGNTSHERKGEEKNEMGGDTGEDNGENEVIGEVENAAADSCDVEVNATDNGGFQDQNGIIAEAVAERDQKQADTDDGVKIEVDDEIAESETMVLVANEYDEENDNGQVNNFVLIEELEDIKDSRVILESSPDLDKEFHIVGETISDSAADIEENLEYVSVLTDDVQGDVDQEEQLAVQDEGKESKNIGGDSQHNLKELPELPPLIPEAVVLPTFNENGDVQVTPNVGRIPLFDENGAGLPTDHSNDNVLGTAMDNGLVDVNHKMPEQTFCLESSESLPCINIPAENSENLATACDIRSTVDLINETSTHDNPKDTGLENDKNSEMTPDDQLEPELIHEKEYLFLNGHDQEGVTETTYVNGKESKSLPFKITCENMDVENGNLTDDFISVVDVVQTHVSCSETADLLLVDNISNNTMSNRPSDSVKVEGEMVMDDISYEDQGSTFSCNDANVKTKDGSDTVVSVLETEEKPHMTSLIEDGVLLSGDECVREVDECVRESSEVENGPALKDSDLLGNDGIGSESEVLIGSVIHCEQNRLSDAVLVKIGSIDVESDEKLKSVEVDTIDRPHKEETTTSPSKGSTTDPSEGQNAGAESEKRHSFYLVNVPRYNNDDLREKINQAQLQVDQKTQFREAIKTEKDKIKASVIEYHEKFKATVFEEKVVQDLRKSKRQEIDSLQSKINQVKSAMSIEDIRSMVRNMEHMIQHETLPLKEEKKLIREIKNLNQLREQLSSTMDSRDVQEALEQKDELEERIKSLRKELEIIRGNVMKAEVITKAAKKKYSDEAEKLKELQTQFGAADSLRQEAYAHLQNLRRQLRDKNKYFRNLKDREREAKDMALRNDREALQHFSNNQVESFMNLWNNNDEFRKDYIRCNMRSTLWRLKTLDGRSLGPDEKPYVIPDVVRDRIINERAEKDRSIDERVEKDITASLSSTLGGEKEVDAVTVKDAKVNSKPIKKAGEQKNQTAKPIKAVKSITPASGSTTISRRDEMEEAKMEEPEQTKEEEELARKLEALRKEEELARLKEQRRLEEKAKAKEAHERKLRLKEKAKAKSERRAQKEAEQKEKEREKRLRKKEKRKGSTPANEISVTNEEEESPPSVETPTESQKESETKEKATTVTKRTYKPTQFVKQSKGKSIPMPLRNRNKRRMQYCMWILLAVVVIIVFFMFGNNGFGF